MSARVIVFEDPGWQGLLPLVYARATFQLLSGTTDLLSRVRQLMGTTADRLASRTLSEPGIWCRPVVAEVVAEQTCLKVNQELHEPALLLNGRGIWYSLPRVDSAATAWIGTAGQQGSIACIAADASLAAQLSSEILLDELKTSSLLAGLPRRDVSSHVCLLDWPWQVVDVNEKLLRHDWCDDFAGVAGTISDGSFLCNPKGIHIGWGAKIKPCVVIDAEDGPVWISDNVSILPHSYIQGPVYIGHDSLIQPGAVVRGGTTIGPHSKVGGEVVASIIQGFSNKQHDGFLGHSYVGSWVNIAADCINSDLKNTYGHVRVPINGRDINSGTAFAGMYVGDFSKAGINVSFPTGAVIGFCSSVFTARSPKFIPSFTWIDGETSQRFDVLRGLAIARKVMGRRHCTMSPAEGRLFQAIYEHALAVEHQALLNPQ